jgi:thiamine-phosphate pyrophosphorylase
LPKHLQIKSIERIIDANINRTKEGLRVCEEITRFILNSRSLTSQFKKIRHQIDSLFKSLASRVKLIKERESAKDVGKNIYINELKRKNYQDIFLANIQRVKESLRVLEEFSKLKNTATALEFKKIRYRIYEIEKRAAKKLK